MKQKTFANIVALLLLFIVTLSTANSQVKQVGTYNTPQGPVPIGAFVNTFFIGNGGNTLRPVGTNILYNGSVTTNYKFLSDAVPSPTGSDGLDFPDVTKAIPPTGYEVKFFYDPQYNVTGWNFQKLGTNITYQYSTRAEADANLIKNDVVDKPDVILNEVKDLSATYAQLNTTYTATEKPRLHCSTHNDNNHAQLYQVKHNGQIVYEANNAEGWHPSTIYWGNHPKETILPVEPGTYDFYFKNNSATPAIVGVTSGDPYGQYMPNGLQGTRFWKRLAYGESVSFSLDIQDTEHRSYILGSWDKSQNSFFVTCPIYENGKITTDKIEIEGSPNGLELPEFGSRQVKFYKLIDPTKNIIIQVETKGISQNATYKLISKNGLDISPDHIMITAYNTSYHKIFNNDSAGYADSPDYKTN